MKIKFDLLYLLYNITLAIDVTIPSLWMGINSIDLLYLLTTMDQISNGPKNVLHYGVACPS